MLQDLTRLKVLGLPIVLRIKLQNGICLRLYSYAADMCITPIIHKHLQVPD